MADSESPQARQRIQNFESKFDEALTTDGYNLLVAVYAGWRISEPAAFFPRKPPAAQSWKPSARSRKSFATPRALSSARHPFNHFISVNAQELKFIEIESNMLTRVQGRLQTNNYGITVEFLGIKKLGLPESVTDEVFQRMSAERQVLVSKIESDGNARASNIRAEADRPRRSWYRMPKPKRCASVGKPNRKRPRRCKR